MTTNQIAARRSPAKAAITAKNKPLSQDAIRRNANDKARIIANLAAAKTDIVTAMGRYVDGHETQAKSARVYGTMLNDKWAEEMAAFKCHWTAFTSNNCRTDNEKAILASITAERDKVKEYCKANKRSLGNLDRPWSDIRVSSKALYQGEGKREREAVALDARMLKVLSALYKAGMKEERPTEEECNELVELGRMLIKYHSVDLSKLG